MALKKDSQTILSSYFSSSPTKSRKRRELPTSPIDLTSDVEDNVSEAHVDEPPIKKIKVVRPSQSQSGSSASTSMKSRKPDGAATYTQSTLFSQTTSAHLRSISSTETRPTGMAEQWAFVPHSPSDPEITPMEVTCRRSDAVEEAEKAKRHEAFKKKLLADSTHFRPRLGVLGTPDTSRAEEDTQSTGTPVLEDVDIVGDSGDESSKTDSDIAFQEVMSMFSHSSSTTAKGKGKRKVSARTKSSGQRSKQASTTTGRRSKKPPPVKGPSGEAYTPLELQVCFSFGYL